MITNNKLSKDSASHNLIQKQKLTSLSFATQLLSSVVLTTMLVACGGGSGGGNSNNVNVNINTNTNTNANTQQGAGHSNNHTPPKTQPNKDDGLSSDKTDTTSVVPEIKPTQGDTTDSHITTTQSDILSPSELTAFNRLNLRRMECGFGKLEVDKTLYNAAKNHTNYLLYMSRYSSEGFQGHAEYQVDQYSGENNPYFTGKDIGQRINTGENIGRLAIPVNYSYRLAGESLSFLSFNQGYKNEYDEHFIAMSRVNSLLAAPYHMVSMLSPDFTQIGISYGQDILKPNKEQKGAWFGSVLEMVLATPIQHEVKPLNEVLTYPCNETYDTQYQLTHEYPNPFGDNGRNLQEKPIGQPVYILANGKLTVTNYKMTDAAGKQVPLKALTKATDPNRLLTESQVILLPLEPLQPSQSYRVSYQFSVDGGAKQSKTIVFYTKAKVD